MIAVTDVPGARNAAAGFTLVELVTVMILIGILAAVALPRMFDRRDFDVVAFRDATVALLRYAQKEAIAQRRDVCVTFAANQASLMIAGSPGNGQACDTTLGGASGAALVRASGNVTFATTPAGFRFHALGDAEFTPSAATKTFTVGSDSRTVTIEGTTGYVHVD
jgi:MSHA pilin protein MshC